MKLQNLVKLINTNLNNSRIFHFSGNHEWKDIDLTNKCKIHTQIYFFIIIRNFGSLKPQKDTSNRKEGDIVPLNRNPET